MTLRTQMRNRRSGVTLIEVLIVLAIMALIIGLGAPRVLDSFGRAKSRAAAIQMENLNGAIQIYYIDVGRYPSESDGLGALLSAPGNVTGWLGPYVDNTDDLTDPWGRSFLYRMPGSDRPFDIFTYGRDGQPGGSSEDTDLTL